MAQVVEPERSLDVRDFECRLERVLHLVNRGAVGTRQHQIAASALLIERLEHGERVLVDRHADGLLALRLCRHANDSSNQIDLRPSQAQQIPTAEGEVHRQHDQRAQPGMRVVVRSRLQQRLVLATRQITNDFIVRAC